jgi:hypothetical protein
MKTEPVDKNYKLRDLKLVMKRSSILRQPKQTRAKTLLLKKVKLENN